MNGGSSSSISVEQSEMPRRKLWRLFRRAWRALALNRVRPDDYARPLLEAFEGGLPVESDDGRPWRAFAEHMDLEQRQVSLRVSLELQGGHPEKKQPRRPMTTERPDPTAPLPRRVVTDAPTRDDPLVLQYSFLVTLPLDQNLDLFREYARNTLRRLRTETQQRAKWATSDVDAVVRSEPDSQSGMTT